MTKQITLFFLHFRVTKIGSVAEYLPSTHKTLGESPTLHLLINILLQIKHTIHYSISYLE